MLTLERGGDFRPALTNLSNLTTAGAFMTSETDLIWSSYSSKTSTLPKKNMLMACCHEMTLIGSYDELSSSTVLIYATNSDNFPLPGFLPSISNVDYLRNRLKLRCRNAAFFTDYIDI